jgi:nitrite reductase (NADH) small subunit
MVDGRPIAIFRVGRDLVALANQCLHLASPIDDGFVEDGLLTCPWHGWRYDVRTGEHLTLLGRRRGLATYPVRVRGEMIEVDTDDGPTRG